MPCIIVGKGTSGPEGRSYLRAGPCLLRPNLAGFYEHIKMGNPIDVCYSIVENYYRGSANTQLRVKDLRERDELV